MIKQDKIASSGIVLFLCLFISKIFGFIREMLIAKYFGASYEVDAYLVATQIPYFASVLISSGITAVFIPIYMKNVLDGKKEKAEEFLNTVGTFIFIILILLVVIVELLAHFIVKIIAPGFSPEVFTLTTSLTRISAPYFFFSEVGMFFQVILQSYSLFGLISLWQIIPNIILICAIVFFSGKYGIHSLTVGFLLTGIVYFSLMLYGILRINIKLKLRFGFSQDFKKFLSLVVPAIVGTSIYNLSLLVDRFIASFLGEGSIAILNFAYRINFLPLTSMVIALSLVIFPLLSKHSSENNIEKLSEVSLLSIKIIIFILMPVFVSFLVLSLPIVRVIYERGNFTPDVTLATAKVLRFFAISTLGYGISEIITRIFYSKQNTSIPLKITTISVGVNIILSATLSFFLGVGGIALATGITSMLNAGLLFKTSLKKDVVGIVIDKNFLNSILKSSFAGVLVGILFYFSLFFINHSQFLLTLEKRVFVLGTTLIFGFALYWLAGYLLKSEEEKIIREKGISFILQKLTSL